MAATTILHMKSLMNDKSIKEKQSPLIEKQAKDINRLMIRFLCSYCFSPTTTSLGSFPGDSVVNNLPANTGDVGSILGAIDPLKKEMETCSSILAWEIPWIEKPGRL